MKKKRLQGGTWSRCRWYENSQHEAARTCRTSRSGFWFKRGENLTIKHDSFHRESFMTGVKLAIDQVIKLDLLVYGLENILE